MNNQNGINEQNAKVTSFEGAVENTAPKVEDSMNMPHDFSKIQELVDQLESKIQKIQGQSLELASIYQKSVQDGSKRQVVAGELYVGKNPTLAKFVEKARTSVVRKVNDSLKTSVVLTEEETISAPAFDNKPVDNIIRTDRFGEEKFPLTELDEVELEEPTSSLPFQKIPIAISEPPLKPESIFDGELIGEESSQSVDMTHQMGNLSTIYQNRGKAV